MLQVFNHQKQVPISAILLESLKNLAYQACLKIKDRHLLDKATLPEIENIEINLIDDKTIAAIHKEFMNITGATDVITFDHGEILISTQTAKRNAITHKTSFQKELLLYAIHGLLHLAGHEDGSKKGSTHMMQIQENLLEEIGGQFCS